jgi:ketosteroid isomerase-like protein
MSRTRASWKFDHVEMPDPIIQLLGPDLFIASGKVNLTSSEGDVKEAHMRYTEVFRKQADGSWLTVHEHIGVPPEA